MSIFNKDFYPTPLEVIQLMGFDCTDKVVLEPSAGSGNIVDYLNENGAQRVLACEQSKDLAEITKSKCDSFLGYDFLDVKREDVSFIDLIVANPPFSNGVKHVLKMWEIAPDGCHIYTLINHDNLTTQNAPRGTAELKNIITQYGGSISLGSCFDNSERKTGVNVGLITLFKPATEESGFEGFFMDDEHHVNTQEGLIKPDKVRDLVERYVDALKEYKEFEAVQKRMNHILKPVGVEPLACTVYETGRDRALHYDGFVAALQRKMWAHVFKLMNLNKYLTSGVKEMIAKFSEQQQKVPFTMKNIYQMVEIIQGTSGELLNKALVEAVDHFTKYTHENRYQVSSWKTNKGHLLGKKFIAEGLQYSYTGGISYGSRLENMFGDLLKVLCNITATNYDNVLDPINWITSDMETGKWYNVTTIETRKSNNRTDIVRLEPIFFTFKFYKKGSIHVKFLDDNVWEMLNRKYAEIKGATLPEKL